MQFSPYVGALGMMRKGMAANKVKPAVCESPAIGNNRAARRLREKRARRKGKE